MTFRWPRTVATAFTILFVIYACWSVWVNYSRPPGIDFVSFWAAGHLVSEGHPAAAYDLNVHRALELSEGKLGGLMPFPYPPPFLLLVTLFGILPFVAAFALWVAGTSLIYFLVFRRIAPWPYTFAHPANFCNALVGQNGMLTSALFAGGFTLLERSPYLAGAVLGLLVIKPQLALLIPIALIAGGHWRAICGAAFSSLALILIAYALLGEASYAAFFKIIGHQAGLANGSIPWPKIASTFGSLRGVGVPLGPALIIHAMVAIAAAAVTWLAWRGNLATRLPIVASATLLISPYLLNYDTLLLMIPIGWLIVHQRHPAAVVLLWATSLLAVAAIIPNPTPIAAIISIALMWREASPERDRSVPGTGDALLSAP